MKPKIKNHDVHFRLSDEEMEVLIFESKKRKMSSGQTAREVLLESLSGFDEKQEVFLRRFDKLDESIELLCEIASLGAAAGTLPLDAASQNVEEVNAKLKAHFELSSGLGKNLLALIKLGKL
jgi:hypothetical protein